MRSISHTPLQAVAMIVAFLGFPLGIFAQGVFVNEVDCDSNTVPDSLEFVELYGEPNTALDGHIVVFYKGGGNTVTTNVYAAFDLDGMSTDSSGFFLLANPAVPGADVIFEPGLLRNGGDAVALFEGDSADFPNGTPLTTVGLLDAVVYGTNDQTNPFLIDSLTPGQPQLDEWLYGAQNGGALAWARLPDGGPAFASDQMVLQQPTPGYTNLLDCDGGLITAQGGENGEALVCVDLPGGFLPFTAQSNALESQYGLVITDLDGDVLDVVPGGEGNLGYNFSGSPAGPCLVWGMSYDGELDPETIEVGAPYDSISASGCVAFSAQPVEVQRIFCLPPSCDGGSITTAAGTDEAIGCVGFANTLVHFGYTSESPEAPYLFVITDANGDILDSTSTASFDFEGLGAGEYEVHGFSYLGAVDSTTFVTGMPVTALVADSCSALSYNSLEVSIQPCDPTGLCVDLFFSEYLDGTGWDKGLELYNPSATATADLGEYAVKTYNNGSTVATHEVQLSGFLGPGEVYTIVNPLAPPFLLQLADVIDDVTLFNGNDATTLERNGVVVDVLGEVGVNPGAGWPVNDVTMLHHTLVRNADVTVGSNDWDVVQNQWQDYPENTYDYFGDHNALPCGLDTTSVPAIGFSVSEILAFEGDVISIELPISLPLNEVEVQVDVVAGGTATPVADFGTLFPVDLTFPQGWLLPQSITVGIVDDFEPEGVESFTLALTVLSGEAEVLIDSVTVTIAPSDLGFPHYPIADVRGIDGNGVLDSLLVPCELRGVVHGFNTYPSGLRFTIIDPTAGIEVFSPVDNFNYLVQEGDSVRIRGSLQQFQGLAQILVDTLILATQGEPLNEPELVNELSEETESALVRLKCVELVNPEAWTNQIPQFEVYVSTGAALYLMVVDADTDLFGTEPPIGIFGVTGIGGQRDLEAPFVNGYTILPRSAADISEPVQADFFVEDPWYTENGPVPFENQSSGAGSYFWTFGDGTPPVTEESPTHEFPTDSTYTVILTATSEDGVCSDQSVQEVTVISPDTSTIGVGELLVDMPFRFGPHPWTAGQEMLVTTLVDLSGWTLLDAAGREIRRGGAVAASQQVPLGEGPTGAGWYVLRLTGADQESWSLKLIRQ
ncbi:MAG: PKD domain-containing protein [Flavobacteriales bacterium]|nr:PKD domain-containing protein [Flavobacteriales bacterium]